MTPARCDQFIARTEFMLDLLEREDVPKDVHERILVLLNLHEKLAGIYTPPKVLVAISEEPE